MWVRRTEVKATELFRKDGGAQGYARILWHPTLPLLATGSSGDNAKVSIWKGFAEGAVPSCQEMPAEHSGAITGLAWVAGAGSGNGMGIASAAADGKVVLCDGDGVMQASFSPFGGDAVQSVMVAQPKGQQRPLLITGSAGNTCIKMWDATGTTCLHSVTFTAPGTSSKVGPEIFRATVDLDPLSDFVLVANTVTAGSGDSFAVYSIHLNTEGDSPHFDCMCEFGVVYPVLSCVVCRDNSAEAESDVRQREMHLYCMQTKAIQQYHLRPDQCCDVAPEASSAPLVTMSEPVSTPFSEAMRAPEPVLVAILEPAHIIHKPVAVQAVRAAPLPAKARTPPPPQDDEVDTLLRQAMSAVPAQPPAPAAPVAPVQASVQATVPPVQAPVLAPAPALAPASAPAPAPAPLVPASQPVNEMMMAALIARLEQSQQATADTLFARVQTANEAMVAKMEAENKMRRQKDRDEMKKNMEAMVTKLSAQMEDKLTKAVSAAITRDLQKEVGSVIKGSLPMALDAHMRSPQYLEATKNAFTAVVNPAMDKVVKGSSEKVVAGIKPALQESFKASFQSSIIPAFESSCQTMFSQIHATFERGQAERMQADESQAAALSKLQALQTVAEGLTGKLHLLEARAESAAASALAAAAAAHAAPSAPAPARSQPQETLEQLAARLTADLAEEKYDQVFSQVFLHDSLCSTQMILLSSHVCRVLLPPFLFSSSLYEIAWQASL